MKKFIFLIFIILVSINVFSQIKEVVVYKDRALITRVEKDKNNIGIHEIVFKSIPIHTDKESLRARGLATKGSGLKILDIKIIKKYDKKTSEEEWKKIEIQIDEANEEVSILKAELKRIEDQKKFMEIFSMQTKKSNNEDLDKGSFSTKQWAEAYNYYQAQIKILDTEYFKNIKEIKKIEERIKILKDKYSAIKNKGTYYSLDAVVSYQLKKDSNIEIILTYIVPGTYWYPIYDCRLDLAQKELTIEYYAKVYQNTGEDWNNIKLVLSTARPDLSGQIPDVFPWQLDFYDYKRIEKDKSVKKDFKFSPKSTKAEEPELMIDVETGEKEEQYQADIDSKGISINYSILQATTIPSGREQTRVTISTGIKLIPQLSWAIVPRYNSSSFLKGKIKNNSDFIFLPGKLSLFVDDSFIGKSNIDLINPNQEFDLSLGRDPRVEAEFKLVDVNKGKKIGKFYETRKYLITIKNNSNEDVKINIKDVIPKSLQPKKIVIKVIKINPEPNEIKEESICSWDVEIKKGNKIEITEEWQIEYPEGTNISGL